MNENRMYQVLVSPHISEKAAVAAEQGSHTFRVAMDASKLEVKKAVEALFSVKVESVRIQNVKGKTKRFGTVFGKQSDWKKAVVRLKDGDDIDFAGIEGK